MQTNGSGMRTILQSKSVRCLPILIITIVMECLITPQRPREKNLHVLTLLTASELNQVKGGASYATSKRDGSAMPVNAIFEAILGSVQKKDLQDCYKQFHWLKNQV